MGGERAQGFRVFGATILDMLGFIGDDAAPVGIGEETAIIGQGRVRCEDQIVFVYVA